MTQDIASGFYEATDKLLELNMGKGSLSETHTGAYKFLLQAPSWNEAKLRILASEYIPKYFSYFASESALNSQLDLVEDEELAVRKAAIHFLPVIVVSSPEYGARIVDVLCQLLCLKEESQVVRNSLTTCIQSLPQVSLEAMLNQIINGNDELTKVVCVDFILSNGLQLSLPAHSALLKFLEEISTSENTFLAIIHLVQTQKALGDQNILEKFQRLVSNRIISLRITDPQFHEKAVNTSRILAPLFNVGYPSSALLSALVERGLSCEEFWMLDATKRISLLRIASDLLYCNPDSKSVNILNVACINMLANNSPADKLQAMTLEPILHCMYKSQMMMPKISSEMNETCLNALKLIFSYAQTLKATLIEQKESETNLRCASNVFALSRELLKPVINRSHQDAHLSWKDSVSVSKAPLKVKKPTPDRPVTLASGIQPIKYDLPSSAPEKRGNAEVTKKPSPLKKEPGKAPPVTSSNKVQKKAAKGKNEKAHQQSAPQTVVKNPKLSGTNGDNIFSVGETRKSLLEVVNRPKIVRGAPKMILKALGQNL